MLGPSVTTVQATEMNLCHFDAILGIPWLTKARPKFDWDHHAIIVGGKTVLPIHHVVRGELLDDYTGASGDEDQSGEWDKEEEEDIRENQQRPGFNPVKELEEYVQQHLHQGTDNHDLEVDKITEIGGNDITEGLVGPGTPPNIKTLKEIDVTKGGFNFDVFDDQELPWNQKKLGDV